MVEAIVAVSILILTLVSPITLAHRGLVSAEYSKDQMTAYNLAEEAVEYIHYLRDLNAVEGNDWLQKFNHCLGNGVCGIDPNAKNEGLDVINCHGNLDNCRLYFNSSYGLYSYDNSSGFSPTTFRRWVTISASDGAVNFDSSTRMINVFVDWKTGKLPRQSPRVVKGFITDWKKQVVPTIISSGGGGSLLPNPTAWWKFDGTGEDSIASLDATISGSGVTFVTGRIGQAINFVNSTDRARTGNTSILNNNTHSIAFWIRFNANSTNWKQILAYKAGSSDRSPGIWTYNGANCIHWRYDPGNTGPADCAGPNGESTYFTIGEWYHIVGVKNGATFTFYVNGVQKEQGSVANPKTNGAARVEMGRTTFDAPLVSLDEVQIYNSALTSVDVQDLYFSFPPPAAIPSLSASIVDGTNDKVGTWNQFSPNTRCDWHIRASFGGVSGKTLSELLVERPTLGEAWSTINSGYYPVVVLIGAAQQNSSYDNLNIANPGILDLYTQSVDTNWSQDGRLTATFTDGSELISPIPASSVVPGLSCP